MSRGRVRRDCWLWLVPLPVCLGFGSILPMGNLPALLGPWGDAGAMFLQSSLPWQRCDPEKGKQGRKRPEKGLRGPYRELSTGPMCRKSQCVWPRRAPMPLEPHGQRFVGGHCPVLGCAGREPRREPLGERVPRPLSGPLAQPSSACCCSWGLPAEGPGLAGGPERHWARRDCGEPTDLVGPGTMVEDEVGPSGLGREAPRDCSPFLLPQPLLGPGH